MACGCCCGCCLGGEVFQRPEFVVKREVAGVDFGLDGAEGGPYFVESDIVVKGGRVVECDSLKLLERGGEAVQLGQTATTLSLDLGLD